MGFRLWIMAYLSTAETADFTALKARLQATDGNLVHLRKLEEAGYVAIESSLGGWPQALQTTPPLEPGSNGLHREPALSTTARLVVSDIPEGDSRHRKISWVVSVVLVTSGGPSAARISDQDPSQPQPPVRRPAWFGP